MSAYEKVWESLVKGSKFVQATVNARLHNDPVLQSTLLKVDNRFNLHLQPAHHIHIQIDKLKSKLEYVS